MTKKRYDKSTDLSRSMTGQDIPSPRPPRRGRSIGTHFEALQPESAEHPVDALVDRIPLIAELMRKSRRRAELITRQVADRRAFIEYEDLRLHLRTERESAYYNIGHEDGLAAGRLQVLATTARRDQPSRLFAHAVQGFAARSTLSSFRTAAVLLELARAYLAGTQTARAGRQRSSKTPRVRR